jgi:predicted dehydrogenase
MKVLFVGLGGVGQRHLRNIHVLCPEAQFGAFRIKGRTFEISNDLKPDYSVDIIKKYDVTVFSSMNSALSFRPDVAIIANPTSLHVETTISIIKSGIPVFLEKPISDNRDGLEELLREVRSKKASVMVGYMLRFHPCTRKVKELIDQSRIGRIYSVMATINSYMPEWHRYEEYNSFYAGRRDLGGGVILTEIHEIDILCWLFGRPSRLWCLGGTYSSLPLDVEDSISVMMEQKAQGYSFPVQMTISFVQRYPMRKVTILGESGVIEWDMLKSEVTLNDRTNGAIEVFRKPDYDRNHLFLLEMKHFLECTETGKESDTTLEKVIDGHYTALLMKENLNKDIIIS